MSPLPLDEYIIDGLMPDLVGHDRPPLAFLVYLLLWRQTHGAGSPAIRSRSVIPPMQPASRSDPSRQR